jgi:DNA polymerase III subunit alpha
VHNLVEAARKVEGISRHASTHAAGVVISKEALTRHVPLQQASKGENEAAVMTQFPMEDIARIGLLKMDFLGLANLTILGKSREIIRQNRGLDIDLYHLPMDDARTFNLLASGETVGVFQLEGSGMRRHIKELKPTTFNDIAAMVALYRPGPMEHIPTFIRGKHGLEPIHYPHPTLQRILEETYGVIVYQEQVLFIVQALAGYSLGQADIFRKAMGKKIVEVMKKEKVRFLEGAVKNGFTPELANEVFALIEPFAGYAFNKAHAVSYALVAYQTAYLKANYPAEYITAFLTIYTGVTDRVATAIVECQRLGIKVLPPDINRSQTAFAIEKDGDSQAIRFGLSAIKNVGLGAIEPVIAERNKNGLFKSVEEFCTRADLHSMNKRVLESLIKVGALDSLGSRGSLLANIDRILLLAQRELKRRETGQTTMFDLFGKETPLPLASLALETTDATPQEKSAWEEELLGVSLSETTLLGAGNGVNADITLCGQIDASLEEQKVAVIGRVVSVNSLLTRDKRPFLSALLKDISGSVEVMVWPKTFEKSRTLWRSGNMLEVKGRVRVREDRVQIGCDSVRPYQAETAVSEAPQGNGQPKQTNEEARPAKAAPSKLSHVVITINQTGDADGDIACLHHLVDTLRNFPGGDKVSLRVNDSDKIFNLDMNGLSVTYCPELQAKLTEMGKDGSIAIKMAGN